MLGGDLALGSVQRCAEPSFFVTILVDVGEYAGGPGFLLPNPVSIYSEYL